MDALGTGIQSARPGASSNVCQFKRSRHRSLYLRSARSCRGGSARQPAVFRTMEFAHAEFGQRLFESTAQIVRWPHALECLPGLVPTESQDLYQEFYELRTV